MTRHIYRYLTAIVILLIIVAWVDWPNNSGNLPFNGHVNTATKLGLDLSGGLSVLLEANVAAGTTVTSQQMTDTMNILENRVNGLGLSDVTFQMVGPDRILAEFPGLTNTDQVISLLKETGQMAFVPMGTNRLTEGTQIQVNYATANNASSSTTGTPSASGTPATSTGTSTATLNPQTSTPTSSSPTPESTTPAGASTTGTPGVTETPGPTATPAPTVYDALITGSELIENSIAVSRDFVGKLSD